MPRDYFVLKSELVTFATRMVNDRKYDTLVLVTDSFPFGGSTEPSFVLPELAELSRVFGRVIIMPTISIGPRADYDMPEAVEVDTSWLDYPQWHHRILRSWRIAQPSALAGIRGDFTFSGITFSIAAHTFSSFIGRWIRRRNINIRHTLFYTFWFDLATCGLALASRRLHLKFFTRAHGHDVYTPRVPRLRSLAATKALGVYAVGEAAACRLQTDFPDSSEKIEVIRLGSVFHGKNTKFQRACDKTSITVLSVARVAPEKRVSLNYALLRALAIARPSCRVKWIHIGDGPMIQDLKSAVIRDCPDNLSVDLRGECANDEVHRMYCEVSIDWTMLLSTGEGLPVSICESLSYGVPVIATAVRGIEEALTDDCALMLPPDPEPEEFVRGIIPYIDSGSRYAAMREAARQRWCRCFDADELRCEFVRKISKL